MQRKDKKNRIYAFFLIALVFCAIAIFPFGKPLNADYASETADGPVSPIEGNPGDGDVLTDPVDSNDGVQLNEYSSENASSYSGSENQNVVPAEGNTQASKSLWQSLKENLWEGSGSAEQGNYELQKPALEQAQNMNASQQQSQQPNSSFTPRTGSSGGLVPCTDDCTLCHLVVGFKNIFDWLMSLLFIATVTIITVGGVFYMVSAGNKGMVEKAKQAMTYAITAFVIGMGCWLFVNTIMLMLGFQNPRGGNWWQFTCDTTQTPQQIPAQGGITLPSGSSSSSSGAGSGPGGSCGGMKVSSGTQNQCVLTSNALQSLLSCMQQNGAPGTITSITGNGIGGDLEKSQAACGQGKSESRPHVSYSCHYGCKTADKGYSHAVDIGINGLSQDQICKIGQIAKQCGSGVIGGPGTYCGISQWEGHSTHLHISTAICNG